MFAKPESSKSDFKLIDETKDGDVAWVKYSTSYDKTPGVWKVTVRDPIEAAPL